MDIASYVFLKGVLLPSEHTVVNWTRKKQIQNKTFH